MAAIYSDGVNRWNILGFNFTKRDALSSGYKISMGKTLHDESLQARVCMRVFSTHMPRSNENKSCMRVDEIINSHPHLTGALASRELKQSCFFTMIKHACQAENVVILDSFISLNCFPLKSSEDSLLLIQYYYRRKPKLRRMF
jgi:hypothetical protein